MSRNIFVYVFKIVSLRHFMACKLVHRKYLSIFIDQYKTTIAFEAQKYTHKYT